MRSVVWVAGGVAVAGVAGIAGYALSRSSSPGSSTATSSAVAPWPRRSAGRAT